MWFGATSFVLLEPPGGQPVEDLPLEGHGAEDAVERADAVGHDDEAAAVLRRVVVADLALVLRAEGVEVGLIEAAGEGGAQGCRVDHGGCRY